MVLAERLLRFPQRYYCWGCRQAEPHGDERNAETLREISYLDLQYRVWQ